MPPNDDELDLAPCDGAQIVAMIMLVSLLLGLMQIRFQINFGPPLSPPSPSLALGIKEP